MNRWRAPDGRLVHHLIDPSTGEPGGAGLLAVTVAYIGILFFFGRPAWKPLISGYLGLLLMGGCFLALGLFI